MVSICFIALGYIMIYSRLGFRLGSVVGADASYLQKKPHSINRARYKG